MADRTALVPGVLPILHETFVFFVKMCSCDEHARGVPGEVGRCVWGSGALPMIRFGYFWGSATWVSCIGFVFLFTTADGRKRQKTTPNFGDTGLGLGRWGEGLVRWDRKRMRASSALRPHFKKNSPAGLNFRARCARGPYSYNKINCIGELARSAANICWRNA